MESYSSIEQLEALSRLTERRIKRRRRKKCLVGILSLILVCLLSTVVWLEVFRDKVPAVEQPFELPASVELQLKDLLIDGQAPSGLGQDEPQSSACGSARRWEPGGERGLGSLPCKRRTEGSGTAQAPHGKGMTSDLGHSPGRAPLPHPL